MPENLKILTNIIKQNFFNQTIDVPKLLESLNAECWKLIPASPEKAESAKKTLLLLKASWCLFRKNNLIRNIIESDFNKFHIEFRRCSPDLIGRINCNADKDSIMLEETEQDSLKEILHEFFHAKTEDKLQDSISEEKLLHLFEENESQQFLSEKENHKNSKEQEKLQEKIWERLFIVLFYKIHQINSYQLIKKMFQMDLLSFFSEEMSFEKEIYENYGDE